MLGQQGNVGDAVAQAGQFDIDDVDAVEQVLAEAAVGHGRGQVLVRGQDHAVSTLKVFVPPTCSNSRSCKTRSSLTCMPGLAVEISSRKIVPPSACLNCRGCRRGARERAGYVAEELAFQQRFRQRRTIEFYKRAVPAGDR